MNKYASISAGLFHWLLSDTYALPFLLVSSLFNNGSRASFIKSHSWRSNQQYSKLLELQ